MGPNQVEKLLSAESITRPRKSLDVFSLPCFLPLPQVPFPACPMSVSHVPPFLCRFRCFVGQASNWEMLKYYIMKKRIFVLNRVSSSICKMFK